MEAFAPHIKVKPKKLVAHNINDERVLIKSKYENYNTITITNKRIVLNNLFSSRQFFIKDIGNIEYTESDCPDFLKSGLIGMMAKKIFNTSLSFYNETGIKIFDLKKVDNHAEVKRTFNTSKYGLMKIDEFENLERYNEEGFIKGLFSLIDIFSSKNEQLQKPSLNNFKINLPDQRAQEFSNEFYQKGIKYIEICDFEKAEFCFRQFCESNTDSVNGFILRAAMLDNLFRFDEAIVCYDKALKINPESYEALNMQGYSLYSTQRYNEAYDNFEKNIKIKCDTYMAFSAGSCLQKIGDLHEALKKYDLALKKDINNAPTWFNIGICLQELGDYKKSIDCYNSLLKLSPNFSMAFFYRGLAYCQLGEKYIKEAADSFKTSWLKAPPDSDLKKAAEINIDKLSSSSTLSWVKSWFANK